MSKVDKHKEIRESLNKLYAAKNKDYGDSFGEGYEEYGLIMPAIRLEDKMRRFKQLIKQEAEVKDESIIDTLMDLANYSIMTIIELKGKRKINLLPSGEKSHIHVGVTHSEYRRNSFVYD